MFLQCHFYISILFTHLYYRLNCIYLFLRLVSASLQASARQREAQQRANVLRDMESVAKVRISTDEFSSFFKNEIWVFSCVCSSKLKFAKRAAYYLVWFGVWCLICTVPTRIQLMRSNTPLLICVVIKNWNFSYMFSFSHKFFC